MRLYKTPRFFRWIFPNKTWGFSRFENKVYLTFDDGPDLSATPWILDLLAENSIKASFFCVGANVLRNPQVYKRIIDEGHTVGNHSMKHEKGVNTRLKEYLASVDQTSELINSQLFRPPYGRMTLSQTKILKKKYKIIMWSWLSYDFDSTIPVEMILENAKKQIKAGDILVLHDNPKTFDRLKKLLPELIQIIQNKGLEFKSIPFIEK